MRNEVEPGERESLYRTRDQILAAKDIKGGLSAASWFLAGETRSVISYQATPGGVLADRIRKAVGVTKGGERRLVTEEGGVPVTMGLKSADPFKNQDECKYGDPECWVKDGKCGEMGCLYYVSCLKCKQDLDPEIKEVPAKPGGIKHSHYIGMTASSLHSRHLTHRKGHESKEKGNVMVKHDMEAHGGEKQQYSAKIIQKERGLLHLALREALLIEKQLDGLDMNGRKERGRGNGLIRVNISSSQGIT